MSDGENRGNITLRAHKRRGRRAAREAATLTTLEAKALSHWYGGMGQADIARSLQVEEARVGMLLRSAARKEYAARFDYVNPDIAAAALNWRAVEVPEPEEGFVELRWYAWPFKDRSPDRVAAGR